MTARNQMDERLAPLEPLLSDPDVTEILIDGPQRAYVEKGGKFLDVESPFRDEAHLMDVIEAIITPLGRKVDEAHPMVDARLPDGSRVNVVIPPISLVGPVLTIRKFRETALSVEDLLRFGSWSEEIVAFLQAAVLGRLNIAVAGGTGSGKTTLLNLIVGMVPPQERLIIIENASEIRIAPYKFTRLVRLESRPPNTEGQGEISMRDLVINALRMRPDRLIVGEVRAGEAIDVFQAMNTGHDGTMFSLHANSPRDALSRLETMATMANIALPLLTVRQQMASALDLIVHLQRLHDGTRKVLKVTEVTGMQGDVVGLQDIFAFQQTGVQDERITGRFTATGHIPSFLGRLREMGQELSLNLFTPV